jgi:DNA-binding MarR family transcriptional regulator
MTPLPPDIPARPRRPPDQEKSVPDDSASGAGGDYAESILGSLRRIIRAIDRHSRQLSRRFNLTVPQLVCLRQLTLAGPLSPGSLASRIYLSQATVTGILDRLEARRLIQRERSSPDRRRVCVSLTESGRRLAETLPWPLQEQFAERLSSMPEDRQRAIDKTLRQVVDMMEGGSPPVRSDATAPIHHNRRSSGDR